MPSSVNINSVQNSYKSLKITKKILCMMLPWATLEGISFFPLHFRSTLAKFIVYHCKGCFHFAYEICYSNTPTVPCPLQYCSLYKWFNGHLVSHAEWGSLCAEKFQYDDCQMLQSAWTPSAQNYCFEISHDNPGNGFHSK